jgi:hypothetical protein
MPCQAVSALGRPKYDTRTVRLELQLERCPQGFTGGADRRGNFAATGNGLCAYRGHRSSVRTLFGHRGDCSCLRLRFLFPPINTSSIDYG